MTEERAGRSSGATIAARDIPRFPPELIRGFRALGDMTGAVSDAMDALGIARVVSASVLKPTIDGARIVGPALTLRNVEDARQEPGNTGGRVSKMADLEAHDIAQRGDILVIEGIDDIANLDGISATLAKRQGELGAIVDGGVRDVAQSREICFPVWSRSITSVTGKGRLETVAINGTVRIAGVEVAAGDLVVADEGAICFIPHAKAAAVLQRARAIVDSDARRYAEIDAGIPVLELARKARVSVCGEPGA